MNEEEIIVWNGFMTKRSWNDEVAEALEGYKRESGLEHRADIKTAFDYYEVDEKRKS